MLDRRMQCCRENLSILSNVGDSFLDDIITMDKTPLSLYVPESRRESKEWKLQGETCSKKISSSTYHRKSLMLSIFLESSGIILYDFAGKDDRIKGSYYSNQPESLNEKE